jgi:hypothetical protein
MAMGSENRQQKASNARETDVPKSPNAEPNEGADD